MKKRNNNSVELPVMYRDILIRKEDINNDDRTVDLTFSSEFKVKRQGWFGDSWLEILDHSPESVHLDRIRAAGPLLVMHDRSKQVGVVESVEIADKKGKAKVRFGKSDFAEEIFKDVQDEIRKTISVGYLIHEVTLEVERDDGPDEYRITDWEPMEISLEPTPADFSIGVGRENEKQQLHPVKIINNNNLGRNLDMKKVRIADTANPGQFIEVDENDARVAQASAAPAVVAPVTPVAPVDVSQSRKEAGEAETKRVNAILLTGNRLKISQDIINRAVANPDVSAEQFNREAWAEVDKRKGDSVIDTSEANLDLSNRDISKYSFLRAVRAQIKGDWSNAGFELECSKAVEKMFHRDAQGFFVPHDVLVRKNVPVGLFNREISTSGDGSGLIATDKMPESFIEALRNRAKVIGLGAFMLTGLVGNISVPKQTGAGTAYWVTEGSDVTTSDSAFDEVALSPKTVGAFTPYTRNMLLQSNPSIEALVMNDLLNVLALAVDLGALHGTGASGQPTGIAATSGIGAVTGTSLDWAAVVEFETDVAAANADIGSMAYLTNATVNGLLKTREKSSGYPVFLNEKGEMNGYPVAVSNQVSSGDMFFGVWSQLLLAFWGALDILIDPFTNAASGGVIIRAFQSVDVGVRHAAAFSYSSNIT